MNRVCDTCPHRYADGKTTQCGWYRTIQENPDTCECWDPDMRDLWVAGKDDKRREVASGKNN